jgi:transketolase C-terminal domain/subunit
MIGLAAGLARIEYKQIEAHHVPFFCCSAALSTRYEFLKIGLGYYDLNPVPMVAEISGITDQIAQ